jgi:polyvinyl alcohol dehydrogenase (cytochrome)
MMNWLAELGRTTRVAQAAFALAAMTGLLAAAPAAADWPVYGHDVANTRDAGRAGPLRAQVASLHPAWTFNSSNGDFTATPTVADGVLVAGTSLGSIYALDAVTGKLLWSRDAGQQINGSAAIDPAAPGGPTVFVPLADLGSPRLLALSLRTGAVRWSRVLTRQAGADLFGSPTFWRGTVYIGTSGPGNDESTARGSVVALSEASGGIRWRTYTVPRGHDGGAVWSTPAIDTRAGRLYVGTGNAYHSPAANTTDAMLALSASTGRILAHYQSTPGDVWELDNPGGGPDYDFGSSPNLIFGPRRQPLVGEGQKSGTYWALNRTTMHPVWRRMPGPGSQADGGISSTGYDGTRIYGADSIDGQIFALGAGGSVKWNVVDPGPLHFSPVAIGNRVLYSADSDGVLTARDVATGTSLAMIPLGGPTFGGISIVGRAVYVAVGTGPPSPILPLPSSSTSQADGSGSIIAFGDTSHSGGAMTRSRHRERPSTFSGSCQLSGSVSFRPGLTNSPQSVSQIARASGRCSGTFTDGRGRTHQLSNTPATYAASEQASNATCAAGTDTGAGAVTLPYGKVDFTITETRAGPTVGATAKGSNGGSAIGEGNVSPTESPVTIAQACGGAGLTRVPIDIRLRTTPSISG